MDILDRILDAAKAHGEDGDPDMEVGDLQQLARDLWSCLTPQQQSAFPSSSLNFWNWDEFINNWLPEENMDSVRIYVVAGPNQGKTTVAHIIKDALENHGFKKVSLTDIKPSSSETKQPIEKRVQATKERRVHIEVVSEVELKTVTE